jgi:hypothetical protein
MAWNKICIFATVCILISSTSTASSIPSEFNPSIIIQDTDVTNLTSAFIGRTRASSIALIQKYLEDTGTALAKKSNNTSTNVNDTGKDFSQVYLDVPLDWGTPDGKWLIDRPWLQPYSGRTVSFAESIWMLSQEDLGTSKYINETQSYTINPIYLLALIQKESGLVYGTYSRETYNNQSLNYRFNRMTGYACRDGQPDCDVEFLGAFRQMYFGVRDTKAFSDGCRQGFDSWNGGRIGNSPPFNQGFKVGSTVTIDGGSINLQTAIACMSYIYTPHNTFTNFFNVITRINQRFNELASSVPLDLGGVITPPASSSSSSSSSVSQPPDTFTGLELKQGSQPDAVKAVEAPKPPPPPPPYVPLYVEENEGNTLTIDPLISTLEIQQTIARSVRPESSSVLGIQTKKIDWYKEPVVVISTVFITVTTLLLAGYSFIRKH